MPELEFVYLHENRFDQIQSNTFSNSPSLRLVNLGNQHHPDGENVPAKINLKERAFADIPKSTSLILLGYVS